MGVAMPFEAYLAPNTGPSAQVQVEVRARVAIGAANGRSGRPGVVFVSNPQTNDAPAPDDPLPGPPTSPGTEVRLGAADPTGVVTYCDNLQQTVGKRGWKVVRKIVSQNAQYGVVWRADVTMPGYDTDPMRMICWRIPGRTSYSFLVRPLQMFDPSQSIPPLAP